LLRNILRHSRNHIHGRWKAQEKEPAPRVGPQTRTPGSQAQCSEHVPALQIPHRGEERREAVAAGDKAKATELFAKAQSIVDTVSDKGIFHKNKAARDKSRLSAKVKSLAAAA
jgi:small subunit ribosomal protein S20